MDSSNLDLDKKHKHKHKCSDEFCKHRKHKKRRKHKKHSHRDAGSPTEEVAAKSNETMVPLADDDDDDDDADTERTDNSDNAQNGFPPSNDDKAVAPPASTFVNVLKEDTMTEDDVASSITEDSSGSSYVSFYRNVTSKSRGNHS